MPACDPVGETLRLSKNQLNYVGQPGATASWAVTVTNTAKDAQTVAVSGRGFTADAVIKKATVTLRHRAARTSPTGRARVQLRHGHVHRAPGAALLNASIAWPASAAAAGEPERRVRVILVDPAGRLAAHSLPQGVGGYGSVQVLRPAAGNWTAVIFGDTPRRAGRRGRCGSARRWRTRCRSAACRRRGCPCARRVGRRPRVGRVPAGAGDSSGSVVFAVRLGRPGRRGQRAGHAARPGADRARGERDVQRRADRRQRPRAGRGAGRRLLVHRSVGPARPAAQHRRRRDARQRPGQPGQRVPGRAGRRDDGVRVELPHDRVQRRGVPVESPKRQLSLYTSNPIPGMWTLIIDFTSPVPGNELSDPFSGRIRFNAVRSTAGSCPSSPAVTLPARQAGDVQDHGAQHRRRARRTSSSTRG